MGRILSYKIVTLRQLTPKCFFAFIVGVVVSCVLFYSLPLRKEQLKENYFENDARLTHLPLLVNTSACKIPDFDPWDPEVASLYVPPYETPCDAKVPKWSTIDHTRNELVFNDDLMAANGYLFKELKCCYMTVSRTKDPKLRPDYDLDYSPCKAITSPRTLISDEFIVVECSRPGFPWTTLVYRMFHALLPPETVVPRVEGRRQRPSLDKMEVLPPNIIILGIDSASRLNFKRFMTNTIQVLESLGAVEMLGFNKVGERTYPNLASELLGYHTLAQVKQLCFIGNSSFHDACPFIWSHLEEAGYLTAHLEDGNTFNYLKDGFNQVPTDFYLRPLFKSAFNHKVPFGRRDPKGNHMEPCTGYQLNNEVMLNYVEAILDFSREQKRPIFNYALAAEVTHDHITGLSKLDGVYSEFLQRLQSKGHLDNSILFVMGDHGYTHGRVRQTMVGFFESKLPVLWIYLPERIRQARPDWVEALSYNSAQLTSPYAFYWSVHLILKTFGPVGSYREPRDAALTTGEIIRRHPNHQSFFEPTPSNSSCDDLGIPSSYCTCLLPQVLSPADLPLARQVALLAVEDINQNRIDPNKCAPLSLVSVQAATMIVQGSQKRFIVTFGTTPGAALFETEITYLTSIQAFDTSRPIVISRINGMTMGDVTCIQDSVMEVFCYCRR